LEGDIVLVDVGAGTHFHTLDFFLFVNGHLTVATPDPTSVLDLYRFIKLAAIRRVLSAFLARDPIATALSNREFQSIQEVLTAVGRTNEAGTAIAQAALKSFKGSRKNHFPYLGAETPVWQGARTAHTPRMERTSNAARRDGSTPK